MSYAVIVAATLLVSKVTQAIPLGADLCVESNLFLYRSYLSLHGNSTCLCTLHMWIGYYLLDHHWHTYARLPEPSHRSL